MPDFYEIDFLDVESPKSGDAITIRYQLQDWVYIHVVDGGFQATGQGVVTHINTHFGENALVGHVVVTHCDGDHSGGLREVLERCNVRNLWMLRPWLYADVLMPYFPTYSSVDRLRAKLRSAFSNLVALEEIALRKGVPIHEPFQGERIGAFTVLAPSRQRYLALVVQSEKTPETSDASNTIASGLVEAMRAAAVRVSRLVRAAWGVEIFSAEETSSENEMSVVQFAELCGHKILLTGDAGRAALDESIRFAQALGIPLPGLDRFQVPHHGSRRNVSSSILDRLLGPKLAVRGTWRGTAIVSSAKADPDHPRKAVVRACIHRGYEVLDTEDGSIRVHSNAPQRAGWGPVMGRPYPEEQEQ